MNTINEILCSKSILDFLNENHQSISYNTPMYNNMRDTLNKYFGDHNGMIEFVLYLNEKYNLMESPLYIESWREFFATNKSRIFFNTFFINIRKMKLETI